MKTATEPKPVDTRTELQRLADEVTEVWSPPSSRAWSLADVRIKKLIEAAKRHSCGGTTQ